MATDIRKISILNRESIHCGFHLVPYIVKIVVETLPSSTYALITDTVVAKYHLKEFQDEFASALSGKATRFIYTTIPPGETTKSRQGKADLEDFLLLNRCTRDTVILALGGGVIGDLVGFVAATFMRGVRFCQIPTTLLAMVDSSIGGKTAIDTPHGKNLIGAFWQPEYIFIDPAFLETLPPREFSNGMAEVIKTAAIWNEDEFSKLESRSEEIFAAIQAPTAAGSDARELLLSVIVGSIFVKAHIVTVDERETGLRNLVNFGHSIGHAIEAVLTPAILHGECIAVGMILEAELSRQRGALSQVAVGRLSRCLRAYNLPISMADPRIAAVPSASQLTADHLLDIMAIDKKNAGPVKRIVLLSRIGECLEPRASSVSDDAIRKVLSPAIRVVPDVPKHHPVRMATPGSKSISNRALLLAALAQGTTRLRNLLHSDDTQVMMTALLELGGAKFEWEDNGETLVVRGGGGTLAPPPEGKEIYLGNAGTASRFLTAVCTLSQQPHSGSRDSPTHTVITGNARMKQRPVGPLVDALRENGCEIEYRGTEGCLPLSIGAAGGLPGGRIRLAASVSSQYVSAVLMCAPYARGAPVELELVGGEVVSQLYIDMTIALMRTFGIEVTRRAGDDNGNGGSEGADVYYIPQGKYTSPGDFAVESDASSATYPLAVAAATGTTCTLDNIGSASLQGDARFAKEVLEPMGCIVVQNEAETTVTGPKIGGLRALGQIDMEPMTDAFLTASVLAAIACEEPLPERRLTDGSPSNTTRIVGIANQRVKECNRIRAMIDQLAKFGVETKELDDGLEIYGRPISELKENASIHCYDDHRVAMAFSVLGSVIKGAVIEEKRCVEKTWPNWWDDLENKIGLTVEGVELPKGGSAGSQGNQVLTSTLISHNSQASVVLIGMRGSGKTFIGKLAARALDWTFIDADHEFEAHHKVSSVREFVHAHGWPAFRVAEVALVQKLLEDHPTKHIISLGGGIVETPEVREMLKAYGKNKGPVVEITRELSEIVEYLSNESSRPAYGEPVEDVIRRREPWFDECATHQFANLTGKLRASVKSNDPLDASADKEGGDIRGEVARYFRHITGVEPNLVANIGTGLRSYFLSLTYPDITPALEQLDALTVGVDAIELRVDLLRVPGDESVKGNYVPPKKYVLAQLSALRQYTALPIVFTVRSKAQGGAHPDGPAGEDAAFELLDLALRTGCEYVDIELCWNETRIQSLRARKGSTQIIASWHDWSGDLEWDSGKVKELYARGAELGNIVKLVGKATSVEDNLSLCAFSASISKGPGAKPLIAINTGYAGQLSRVLNKTLCPVTHPLLPISAAPGQLSFAQIQTILHLICALPARRYFLLGMPISASPSPTLYNTGFETLGLPHRYERFETQEVDEAVERLVRSEEFGGASVTIPHKRTIIRLVDELTVHARTIGAVNTLVVVEGSGTAGHKILRGDNTDWIGIRNCVIKHLRRPSPPPLLAGDDGNGDDAQVGLVIGAGGTARAALYALHSLGISRILLFNRTRTSAEALVATFSDYRIQVVDSLEDESMSMPAPTIIISTVPGSATVLSKLQAPPTDSGEQAGIYLPKSLFRAKHGGVVVEMAYKPAETPLLKLASEVEIETGARWGKVRGVDVLLEQGYAQFEILTARRAPRSVVQRNVLEWYESS